MGAKGSSSQIPVQYNLNNLTQPLYPQPDLKNPKIWDKASDYYDAITEDFTNRDPTIGNT